MATISVRAGIAALFVASLLVTTPVGAADSVLLIQMRSGGHYQVWHGEGESLLSEDDVMTLEASAKPDGGEETPTSAVSSGCKLIQASD